MIKLINYKCNNPLCGYEKQINNDVDNNDVDNNDVDNLNVGSTNICPTCGKQLLIITNYL